MKFGGTSVGSAERMAATAEIIRSARVPVVVVLSAMSGITNRLLEVAAGSLDRSVVAAHHKKVVAQLGLDTALCDRIDEILNAAHTQDETVACGELLSTTIMQAFLSNLGIDAVWVPALDFMRTGTDGTPDTEFISEHACDALQKAGRHQVYITQGFICRDANGHVTTLTRGGSDYTATLLGEALRVSEVQIWTDVDGVYTADPRHIGGARCIPDMSFGQADTAARCGAKILHPDCIRPARRAGISVRVLDSFHPEAAGTRISDIADAENFVAVAFDGTYVNIIGHDRNTSASDVTNAAGVAASECDGYIRVSAGANAYEIMQTLHDKFVK
ncbi:MAG: aspartate kinase [Muribaculaceae bacterium]|nr:aspartate kinase [Muribaculaceae bacterium]